MIKKRHGINNNGRGIEMSSSMQAENKQRKIRRPPGANRRRSCSLDYLLQSTIPDIADNPLSTGLRDCLLLVQRASLGTHGVTFYHRGPLFFPAGDPPGAPYNHQKTTRFLTQIGNKGPQMNDLEGYPSRSLVTATCFQLLVIIRVDV